MLVCIGLVLVAPVAAQGRFVNISMDGSLSEWLVADRLYQDSEIGDGAPLSSTYSDVYVANDADYVYIGLKLKAPSSIFSNWTHALFIDTDGNSGTGYNAGWMSGGYDRLVQYGSGGSTYSIYTFSGSAQWEWSWSWNTTFSYAYNGDEIEWAIPRAHLGGATAVRLQFLTEGGDVTVQTWANEFESGAKTYTLSATPNYNLTVTSGRGTPSPAVGTHSYAHGTTVNPSVITPAPASGTQYVSLGWTMTGHSPVSGTGTNFTMTMTNNATLNWLWQTNVQLTRTTSGSGSLSGDGDGYYQRNSTVNLTANPNAGYIFKGWSGDVPPSQTNDNPLALTMDRARSVTANFGTFTGKFQTKALDGALGDWGSEEAFYVDAEITDGSPLASTYSTVYVANDHEKLYIALDLKGNSTIFDNWTHHVFIDTDLNPATGYNAGWMSGGYDVLVTYGAGGGTYSVFSFSGGTQSTWSWSFLSEILYAYNDDVVEWSIPRSALSGSTSMKIQLMTEGGDVGYGSGVTWANASEAQARIYTMAATPNYNLTVTSGRGTPSPAVGTHSYAHGTTVNPSVITPAPASGTQYVSLGWTMTGHSPVSGTGTNFTMTMTNNATLNWLWQTNVQLTRTTSGSGSLSGDGDGYYQRNSTVNLTANPNAGYIFKGWSGDVPPSQTNDNPLALTMDRARSVTANFGTFTGKFQTKALDGALGDWGSEEAFYVDAEITDGSPLASTYSTVYVANDHEKLYIALDLKGNSTIFDNWTHHVFIDTDLNPATGYNAGWMSGGYDVLVTYGAGGGTYSVFSFSGGTQSTWSWTFLSEILYAYNDDVVEWSIPRSALSGSTSMKIQLMTEGGDVGYGSGVTWAHSSEAQARIYTMAATPNYNLTVTSGRGTPSPAVGTHSYAHGTTVNPSVAEPTPASGTQYVSLGWAMTGHSPVSGTGTNFTMTMTNNATLNWLWQTNVQFTRSAGTGGSVSGDTSGYYEFGTVVNVTATPNSGYIFAGWSGDVPPAQVNDNPLALTMNAARSITATFQRDLGRYVNITLDGDDSDWLPGDVFYADSEITDGAPLNSTYAAVYAANDTNYLFIGLAMKDVSSIFSNWTHNLFIDVDGNPATGYNAGWMSGGYDRLVQYGVGGSTYSIFSFSGGSQSAWSWSFVTTIGYAYTDTFVEWAIPRSALGGANEVRLQFLTDGTGISIETWAAEFESAAKTYAFSTPDGCVPGYGPAINPIGNKTVNALSTLSFNVTAHDPFCVAPILSITGKPASASFSTSISGTNRVGTFSWTPGVADVGVHLVQFRATDDEGSSTTRLIRIHVGNVGEGTNSAGIPLSLTNWAVAISDIPPSGGSGDLTWEATPGIPYDLYYSDDDPSGTMTWHWHARTTATTATASFLVPEDDKRYYSVMPAGSTPDGKGIWGVIKPTVPSGFSLFAPPLDIADLTIDGELGDALRAVLPDGSKLHILNSAGAFVTITKAGGNWDTPYTLAEGQGFFIESASGTPVNPRFAGPVGNNGTATRTINPGSSPTSGRWNILGLSQGKTRTFAETFATANFTGTPTANWNQNFCDVIAIDLGGGVFRRVIRAGDGVWRDATTLNPYSGSLAPGTAVYYFRYGDASLSINF